MLKEALGEMGPRPPVFWYLGALFEGSKGPWSLPAGSLHITPPIIIISTIIAMAIMRRQGGSQSLAGQRFGAMSLHGFHALKRGAAPSAAYIKSESATSRYQLLVQEDMSYSQ